MSKIGLRLVALAIVIGAPGCGDNALSPPAPGIYQLENMPNTLVANVEIDPGGTFRWGGGGCDVTFDDGGQWQVVDDRLVLTPGSDNKVFSWPLNPSGSAILTHDEFKRLEITAGPREGELIASGLGEIWGDYSASWLAGGMCPTGCATPAVPCEDPYVGSCYGNTPPVYCHPDP
jgi:hypothetical protein